MIFMCGKELTNICLVGFMGTGKTSVGKLVAEKTGKKFIETDSMIVEMAGKSIPEIFSEDGEISFREWEIQAIKKASTLSNCVFSVGGGVVLNNINILYLKRSSVIICLTATSEIIYKRTMAEGKEKRPLLAKEDPMKEIENLLCFRSPFYAAATNLEIDTTDLTEEGVAREIIDLYEEKREQG
jgi:shikimate kinase